MEFNLENGSNVIVRPSGTEPKIKIYIEAVAKSTDDAVALSEKIKSEMKSLMGF